MSAAFVLFWAGEAWPLCGSGDHHNTAAVSLNSDSCLSQGRNAGLALGRMKEG